MSVSKDGSVQEAEPGSSTAPSRGASTLDNPVNKAIVQILQQDGRTPFSEIANTLGVSEGTIRNRVNAMKESGYLRVVAVTDTGMSQYLTEAMVGIKVASGHRPEDVARRLSALDEVVFVVWVSGSYDLMIEVMADDRMDLLKILSEHVHAAPDIGSSDVMTGLMNFKNQFLVKS